MTEECHSEVPPGCTPLVQPMDVSINRPFKARMESLWVSWFQYRSELTPKGNLKLPTRQNAIDWVSTAWAGILISIIEESFVVVVSQPIFLVLMTTGRFACAKSCS